MKACKKHLDSFKKWAKRVFVIKIVELLCKLLESLFKIIPVDIKCKALATTYKLLKKFYSKTGLQKLGAHSCACTYHAPRTSIR